jgi:TRAP-type C4-dicarboxylate transport system substrate-binding protein
MFTNRLFKLLDHQVHLTRRMTMKTMLFVFLFTLALSACVPAVTQAPAVATVQAPTPTAIPVQNGTITLRFAVSDPQDGPAGPSIHEFIDQVTELSGGNIIIQPVWEAGAQTAAGDERGVIAAVKSGDYDLGQASSRAFDLEGVTFFQALQTPFLIDSDALAVAVAQSEVAVQMLEGISAQGLSGLTLWPEDLRHPVSLVPGKPLVSPDDFTSVNIDVPFSDISIALIKALGGTPVHGNSMVGGAEAGLFHLSSLPGTPIATGNVVFFPKFQVLFANDEAFDQLSEAQRVILGKAASAAQVKAIASRPDIAEAGDAWCTAGASIVLASNEQVTAFVEAAQPVIDQIEADPANAKLVAAIREMRAGTQAGPEVRACGVVATQPTADDGEQTWSAGLPPNGVWQVELTDEDVVRMGVIQSDVGDWAGKWTWTFQDGNAYLLAEVEVGDPFDCKATYEVVGDIVRLTYFDSENCYGEKDDIQWRLDDDGLYLHLVAIENSHYIENKAMYEAKPWQKIVDK